MYKEQNYDCAIIGGGVAGLALSILLAQKNKKIILFEKEIYPFHKVCGEYISNESIHFIERLGLDLSNRDLPKITSLLLSSPSGISIQRLLSVGGIGISRYQLDWLLYQRAIELGVEVKQSTKVRSIQFSNDCFEIRAGEEIFNAAIACGTYGKNSNIDVQLNRTIRTSGKNKLFIAVKNHIKADFDPRQVEMHNFNGGYCGLSAIEDGKINISYITRIENLHASGNDIQKMQKNILSKNPFLKKYFSEAIFEMEKPLVISHIQFGIKNPVEANILMLGDAAGNIAPLSGNGISMALNSANIACKSILPFLGQQTSRDEMEIHYLDTYKKTFSSRIRNARFTQRFLGKPAFTNLHFSFLKIFPFFVDFMQEKIHGKEF